MSDKAKAKGLVGIRDTADLGNLRLIVAGLTEGVILIHPDQTILWANDAALRMHGAASLDALGDTVDEYRRRFELRYHNNHRLGAGEYPVDRVVSGETFTEVTVEVAPAGAEEPRWVHQIRSLVLVDAKGEPDCLVLVLLDVTERAQAEERFSQAFNANPAPAMIGRLSDLRVIKVNQGFLDMTGFERARLVGRTVYEIDLFARAADRELAHERLSEGKAVPQMETELALPDGSDKLMIVAGQPIDFGDECCMLFTFADLEPRRKAETALRHSEERFQKAFDLAPVAMVVASLKDHTLLNTNQAFHAMTGHEEGKLIGHSPGELTLWDTAATRRRLEEEVERTGALRNVDAKVRTRKNGMLDCLVSAATVDVAGDACVLWVIQDITERRQSEMELVTAIETVMSDASWFSRNVVEKLANLRAQQAGTPPKPITELTAREKEVLALACQGEDDATIAQTLGMSRTTVRNHIGRIYAKIGVNKRGAAIVWARERGLAKPLAGRARQS
ncbi:MAG: PAS domain S-box protein [Sphingomonas sp.]|nr:MAG: PAS domain S-box protein [Sphingomonas sp.]